MKKNQLLTTFWESRSVPIAGALLMSAFLFATVGCGGGAMSQADLRKYGISRSDDDDDEDEDEAPPAANASNENAVVDNSTTDTPIAESPSIENTVATPGSNSASAVRSNSQAASSTQATSDSQPIASTEATDTTASELETTGRTESTTKPGAQSSAPSFARSTPSGLLPIAERRPSQVEPNSVRRQASAENIETITNALLQMIEESYKVPTSVVLDSRGRPGLSWRVHILPLLGYEGLYKQFKLSEPWDSEHNKALLKYIPPEYVSPERYDENTNYQLFVNGPALFSEKEKKEKSEISDGPNILLLAEVDDELAVPWTSPFDYDVREEPITRGLGNVREDGVFVGWMTGQASVWPNPINPDQVTKAVTFEAGDGIPFAPFMAFPPANPGGSSRPAIGGSSLASSTNSASSNTLAASPPTSPGNSITARSSNTDLANITRVNIPPREQILAAENRLRETYQHAFEAARTPAERAKLAQTIRQQITTGSVPPAEQFVGLRAAMNVAVQGRDPRLALQVMEELNARFDTREAGLTENLLKGFLGDGGTLRTELSKGSALIPLLENQIDELIGKDDFRGAAKLISYGNGVVRAANDRETNYRWKIVKERVDEGKRHLPRIAKHIETLSSSPDDPAANFAVGWYVCIVKNNWNKGIAHLAKANDDDLRNLAQLEIQEDSSMRRHLLLADGWWDYASEHREEPLVFEASMQRARKWYLSASIGLTDGLDRIKANDRLERINRMIGKASDPNGTANRSL